MNRNDLKIMIAGLLISIIALSLVIFPSLGVLTAFMIPDSELAIMGIILTLHSAVFISGLYIGFSNAGNKYLISFIVGILYFPTYSLIASIIIKKHAEMNFAIIPDIMVDGFACVLGSVLAKSITRWRDISVL